MVQQFKLNSISSPVFLQKNCKAAKKGGKHCLGGDVLRAGVIKAWKLLFSTLSTLYVFFALVHSPSLLWNEPLAQTNEMAADYVCFTNYSQGKGSLRSYQVPNLRYTPLVHPRGTGILYGEREMTYAKSLRIQFYGSVHKNSNINMRDRLFL